MTTPQGADPVAGVIPGGFAGIDPFPPGSRYHGLPLATVEIDGEQVRYVGRRLVPPPSRFTTLSEHIVTEGDRIDNIAAVELGDPELFWRLADANGVMHPEEAVARVGRRLRITLPEGIPGPGDVVT
jgi:hypothetical protein